MTNAYDRSYLLHARQVLGRMLDFACHGLGYSARAFWEMFLASGVASAFGAGEVRFIAGMSGYELAYEVLDRCAEKYRRVADPSPRRTTFETPPALNRQSPRPLYAPFNARTTTPSSITTSWLERKNSGSTIQSPA